MGNQESGYLIATGSSTSSPLMKADVWLDLNRNFLKDADEPAAITDADGHFTLAIPEFLVQQVDANGNGDLKDEHLRLISIGGIDSLTAKRVDGMVLIGDFNNDVLTPVTTLATLLADAGVPAATSAAIQKAFGVAVVDVVDHSSSFDPYEALAKGDTSAFPQVLAHTQLAGLLLMASSLGKQANLSPVASLQKLAGALAKADPASFKAGTTTAEQRQALLAAILPDLAPSSFSDSQRAVILGVFSSVTAELDALQAYANQFRSAGVAPRSLLPASNSLKAILTSVFTESLPQVLDGTLGIDQLQKRFAAQLAGGALDASALSGDHLVSVAPWQNERLLAGGTATFVVTLGSSAPAHGLRLIYSLDAPEGSTIKDKTFNFAKANASDSGTSLTSPAPDQPITEVGELIIPAGFTSGVLSVRLPDVIVDDISQISLNLRYVDSGFVIDENGAAAVYRIDGLRSAMYDAAISVVKSASPVADQQLSGGGGDDRIDAGWGDDNIVESTGDDLLYGEGGNDSIDGGEGNDYLDGGIGDDVLDGGEGDDWFSGGIGDDQFSGGTGEDVLGGDTGSDRLDGGEGDDKLDGGSGNDVLEGGSGLNVLFGGSGADRFVLKAPGGDLDLILDFNPVDGDQLLVLKDHFPDAVVADFAIIGGELLFRGSPIALVANNGRSYGLIRDLTSYIQFSATAEPRPEASAASPLAGTSSELASPAGLRLLTTPSVGQERRQITSAAPLLANDPQARGFHLSAVSQASNSATGLRLSGDGTGSVLVDLSTLNAESLADSQVSLLVYRVNSQGEYLGPDGSTAVANLEAAVIGTLGAVNDDFGHSLFAHGSSQLELSAGQELRFALSRRDHAIERCALQISDSGAGLTLALSSTGGSTPDLSLRAVIASANAASNELALARKAGLPDLLYLRNGETLDLALGSSCANTNTYAFVKVDLTFTAEGLPAFSIRDGAGVAVPLANSDAFRRAIRSNLATGFTVAQGGHRTSNHSWTVANGTGFYAPVMLSQKGDVFFIGSHNSDGRQHIKPIGDGAYAFEDLSGATSDFDYNDGVLRISRRVPVSTEARSLVIATGSPSAAAATYLGGGLDFSSADTPQLVHSNGRGANTIATGSAADTVVLYGAADQVSLGAGADAVHLLTGSANHSIDLGVDRDADRLFLYRPARDQLASEILHFDPQHDTLTLVNLDASSKASFTLSSSSAILLVDDKPLLTLMGSFSADALNAALRRSDLGVGDAVAAIAERGLLVTGMIPNLRGSSELGSDGQWYGYNVDLARALSEQLTGSPDRLVIRPSDRLLDGLTEVRTGFTDLGLLGSTSTTARDVTLGIDFSRPYLVDTQGLLVKGTVSIDDLEGKIIGVVQGSTARLNALSFLSSQGITATVIEFATTTALAEALRTDEIAAIASDCTRLLGYQATIDGSTLLEETFSPQRIAVALPENQSSLKDAVNWIVQVPAAAESLGLTAANLPKLLAQAERGGSDLAAINPQIRVLLDLDPSTDATPSLGGALGLARGFTQKVLARLGNAAELWKRHFPSLENPQDNTAAEGGLLRSLPFLGDGSTDPLVANDNRGDLLALIRERGTLQVATGGTTANAGFSAPDGNGSYKGVDADLARAIAIAIFGDASKVSFQTDLSFSSTFAAVANGSADLALRAATANLWRDGSFGVDFSEPYLQTGLKILTHSSLGVSRIDQLNGSTIGVIAGTTAGQGVRLALAKIGAAARLVTFANASELYAAFREGEVEAIARDGALLAGFQAELQAEENAMATTMLSGQFSYEPLGVVVDENQSKLLDLVNAVIAILKEASTLGITADTVDEVFAEASAADAPEQLRQFFQLTSDAALPTIGLTPDRIKLILGSLGNLDEIVERSTSVADNNENSDSGSDSGAADQTDNATDGGAGSADGGMDGGADGTDGGTDAAPGGASSGVVEDDNASSGAGGADPTTPDDGGPDSSGAGDASGGDSGTAPPTDGGTDDSSAGSGGTDPSPPADGGPDSSGAGQDPSQGSGGAGSDASAGDSGADGGQGSPADSSGATTDPADSSSGAGQDPSQGSGGTGSDASAGDSGADAG